MFQMHGFLKHFLGYSQSVSMYMRSVWYINIIILNGGELCVLHTHSAYVNSISIQFHPQPHIAKP